MPTAVSFPPAEQAKYYLAENWIPFLDEFEGSPELTCDSILVSTGRIREKTPLNLSAPGTVLINLCGRFAEHYASDLFINWDTLRDLAAVHPLSGPERYLVLFGIRESGVDCNAFVLSRLASTLSGYSAVPNVSRDYRRLLAALVSHEPGVEPGVPDLVRITVSLRDMTKRRFDLAPDFLSEHGIDC